MDEVMKFLADEALIIVPALWFIGCMLKNTPAVKDWLIPWILIAVGIFAAVMILGFAPSSVVQGVLVACAAVTGHQLLKQTMSQS